jgi:8-oxo-dGTP pyrophosphatase MutT (NUDIX family)
LTAAKREFSEEVGIDDLKIIGDKNFITNYTFQEGKEKIYKTVTYWLAFVKTKEVKTQKSELN